MSVTGSFTAVGDISATFNSSQTVSELVFDGDKGVVLLQFSRGGAGKWQLAGAFSGATGGAVVMTPDTSTDYRLVCEQLEDGGTITYNMGP